MNTKFLAAMCLSVGLALLGSTAASAQEPDGTIPLLLYWHGGRQDNFTLCDKASKKEAEDAGYEYSRVEGYIYQTAKNGTVPLRLYRRADNQEYLTLSTEAAKKSAEDAGYKFVRIEGYVYKDPRDKTVPLLLYWSEDRKDYCTTSSKIGQRSAEEAGYKLLGVEGYVFPAHLRLVNQIKQGGSDTCWILSAMEALQYSGVDLEKQVRLVGKNRYQIRLYNYLDPKNGGATYAERCLVDFDGKPIDQDPVIKPGDAKSYWVVALHRGVITAVHEWDPTLTIEKTHSGFASDAFAILTGRTSMTVGVKDPNVRTFIEAALKRRAAIVVARQGHFYAVLKSSGDEVLLHDPTGETKPCLWKDVIESGDAFVMLEANVKKGANLLVNGSFEEGPDVDDRKALDSGSALIKGWKATRGPISYVGDAWAGADGYRSIQLHGSPGFGGIEQTFKTKKGQRYRITFSLAGAPEGDVLKRKIGVGAAGQKAEFSFDSTGKSAKKMGWAVQEWEFVANAAQTTLEFYTLEKNDGQHGPAIDDIRVVPVPAANLLVNGSFEEGPEQGHQDLQPGSTAIKGWKVIRPLLLVDDWIAADGKRSLMLCGPPESGAVAQTFKTTKGQRYHVSFALASNPNGGRWPKELSVTRMEVSAAGKAQDYSFDSTGKTTSDMGWVTKEWEFEAVADQTTLEFRILETGANYWNGPALDNVRVWAVPAK